jgi:hypothetical protein
MSAPKPQSFAEALEARPSDQLAGSLAATSVRFAPETWSEEDGSFDAVLNTGGWVDRWSYARGAYKLRLGVGAGQVDLAARTQARRSWTATTRGNSETRSA